jgi:hypothetical protein
MLVFDIFLRKASSFFLKIQIQKQIFADFNQRQI